ncbi:MAG: tRNA pseudouridine(38-40) synthase TruA [Dehalococcoidia bacterium]
MDPSSFRRIALLLEYDGAAYGGSQRQRNAPSVQAALEEAIARLTGHSVRTAFAGRTDAGVHALGQVAAFDTEAAHTPEVWRRALNALLPEDIAVREAAAALAGFDPRRHARSRTYRYQIWNAPVRSPLWRRQAWHVRESLDVAGMSRAAAMLVGEHDFAAFGGSPGPGRSTRRRVLRAELRTRGPLLSFEIEGTAFLPHQVRRTAGALAEVGRGRLPPERFQEWLEAPEPSVAGPAAPPHGLCLMTVSYAGLEFTT